MSRVWISKPVVSRIEEEAMSLSGFHYCICAFTLCSCRSFNPSLCRLSPFLLPYVPVSRPFSLQCRNLAKQSLKTVVKTSVINGELPKGGDIKNTTVCIDLMGLKVSKWNKPGGRGGDSAYERGGDTPRKFWIKPLKETDLGVAQAFC